MRSDVRRWLAVILLVCACEHDASAEAILFLDRLDQVDLDDPVADRQRIVDNLAHMPLRDPQVRQVRAVCVDAHRSILEAEILHARARDVVGRYPDEADIPAAQRVSIQRDIDGSSRALARSERLIARCHQERDELRLSYRHGR